MFADNFAYYSTGGAGNANMLLGKPYLECNAAGPTTSNPRPNGTHAYQLTATTGGVPGLRIGFDANWTTIWANFAVRPSASPSGNDVCYVMQLRDGSNNKQMTVCLGSANQLIVRSGSESGTILGSTANAAVPNGQTTHVEVKVVVHGSAGTVEVRVNEVTMLTLTGVNTAAAGGTTAASNAMRILGGEVNNVQIYDYSHRQTGDLVGDPWIGDVQWLLRVMNADTAQTDFVRNTGLADYACINETPQDGDTTYIEATNVGDKSDFTFAALPGTVSEVIAIVVRPIWRKTLSGTSTCRAGVVSSASVSNGATKSPATNYGYEYDTFALDPHTGVAWTPTSLNAAKVRLEKVS